MCPALNILQLDGSQTQTQSDFVTQNELTQIGDAFEESNSFSPSSVIVDPRLVSWGRLIAEEGEGRWELQPRDPKQRQQEPEHVESITVLGCLQVHMSEKFNEFTLGRNSKMDISPSKPSKQLGKHYQIYEWAHSMVSNKHCVIYCMWNCSGGGKLDVFVEDSSGNGTMINGTILLKRGEKRLIHTGDEICLVNPHPLKKKIRNPDLIQQVQRRYTYIFVNVFHQQQALGSAKRKRIMPPPSSVKRRVCAVDPRSMVNHSLDVNQNYFQKNSPKSLILSPFVHASRVEELYDIRDTLGTGTCGEVKRAICRRTGKEFAVKIISIGKRTPGAFVSDKEFTALEAEASILKALDHPYIVRLYDVFVHPNVAIYLVMELMSGGDLYDRIVSKTRYTEVESRRTMRRLLNAVFYLHERKSLVHRDLKPENILCSSRSNDVEVKLTDFGLAKSITQEGLKTFCGTPQYFAPEVMRRNYTIAGKGRYGREADMWSLGVILFVLLSGMPPFDISEGFEALGDFKVAFPDTFWSGVSHAARDMVRKLLETDPAKRLSVVDACEHPWINMDDGDTHRHPLDDPVAPMRSNMTKPSTPLPSTRISPESATSAVDDLRISEASTVLSPSVLKSQVTPPLAEVIPLPEHLNSRSNRFREFVTRSAEKVKAARKDGENAVSTSHSRAASHPECDTKPTELIDDDIYSHFSDESRSSISESTMSTKAAIVHNPSTSSADELNPENGLIPDGTLLQKKSERKITDNTPQPRGIDVGETRKQQKTLECWLQKRQ